MVRIKKLFNKSQAQTHRWSAQRGETELIHFGYTVLIRISVHMSGLLYVHMRKTTFSLSPFTFVHTSHYFLYLPSLFPNCIQNDVTSQRLCLSVGFKIPKPIKLTRCIAKTSNQIWENWFGMKSFNIQWRYEYWTSPDFEWWKVVWMPNGPVSECHLNTENPNRLHTEK